MRQKLHDSSLARPRARFGAGLLACALWLGACASDDGDEREDDEAPALTAFESQAQLGATLYGQRCATCHGANGEGAEAPRLVGLDEGALPEKPPATRQVRKVDFVTVADVAAFVVANMPPGQAGSLSQDQYLAILAFDLKANGISLEEELSLALASELTIPR